MTNTYATQPTIETLQLQPAATTIGQYIVDILQQQGEPMHIIDILLQVHLGYPGAEITLHQLETLLKSGAAIVPVSKHTYTLRTPPPFQS